jgi:broad specificity phosphatase PhoE
MTTFYFFRHGYSCSNYLKDKSLITYGLINKNNKDPHLTDWGILSSILAGKYLKSKVKFTKAYVSPLIRTWETGACMFPDQTFYVGPYLTEGRPDINSGYIRGSSDTPNSYKKNIKRFKVFKEHLEKLKDINNDYIKEKINKIQKVKIINEEDYDKRYTLKGDIKEFIKLKKNEGGNILVICHGTILLKEFVKNNNNKLYKTIKDIGHNNNYGIKVSGDKIELFFEGVKKPEHYIECSLCNKCTIEKDYNKMIIKNYKIISNKTYESSYH